MNLGVTQTSVLILAGGLGTRLRPVIGSRPKALAPVAGRPFIHYLLTYLNEQRMQDVIICAGHGASKIYDYVGDGRRWSLNVHYSIDERLLGTGGAIKNAEPSIRSDPVIVLNGDSFIHVELSDVLKFHKSRSAKATVTLALVENRARFGAAVVSSDGSIVRFMEKGLQGFGWINAGVYVLDRSVVDDMVPNRKLSLELDVLAALSGSGLYGMKVDEPMIDIGTIEAYSKVCAEFRS